MIYTLTVNPAVDKLIFLDKLEKNRTNRPLKYIDTIGGKGTHVSINLNKLNEKNRAIVVTGGKTGDELVKMLHGLNVNTENIHSSLFETRTNVIIIESNNDCTIIAGQGELLPNEIIDKLFAILKTIFVQEDYLVLSGAAGNISSILYRDIIKEVSARGVKVFLDASDSALQESIKASPFLIKPNLDELSQICGKDISLKNVDEIIEGLYKCDEYGIEVIAVSLGSAGSFLKMGKVIYRALAPKVDVRNTIGCGDAYLSGLVFGFQNKLPIQDILVLATAIASATAENELSVGFDYARMVQLKSMVRVEQIAVG